MVLAGGGEGGGNKTQSFQKLFSGDIFLYLLNIFANAAPKSKTIKNYSSILAIVNHRNWPDDSPPLRVPSTIDPTLQPSLMPLTRRSEHDHLYYFQELRVNKID